MIKGTRFFSRRLLPLLLAAVMLLGMLPALTLPVLAEEPPALTNVAQGKNVSIHGPTSGADRPASWLTDGITDSGKYVEISKDTEQNSTDPSYAQIDLGTSYDIAKVEFWNYWDDGRTLIGLVILASEKVRLLKMIAQSFSTPTRRTSSDSVLGQMLPINLSLQA